MIQIEQIAPIVTKRLRQQVLYPKAPIEHIILPEDDQGYHFGLYLDNKLISVISLFIKEESAQFRKFATDEAYQNKGYGSTLFNYMIDFAKQEQVAVIWCNARFNAQKFYFKHGLTTYGEPFERNGIFYIKMKKNLT